MPDNTQKSDTLSENAIFVPNQCDTFWLFSPYNPLKYIYYTY